MGQGQGKGIRRHSLLVFVGDNIRLAPLLIIGIITQIMVAGNGIYHEEQFPRVKRPRSKPETREERKQRKYRYLYQVRTCHGDVISQPIAKKYVHQVDESCA